MKKVELLSPAGDKEKLEFAIHNGADAVYLGLDEFNARANQKNFDLEGLKSGISYAHLFGVKVYLAINILFKDDEIPHAMDVISSALSYGVDALILQDIALASLVKRTFPNAILHASTQMGCSNLEGARFLKNLGFSRIVLARETKLEDIKLIKDNLDIEIEYFVHGALCVSYSGNCYLCSMLANASGNRGKCKQFCRLPSSFQGNGLRKEGYMLSTKDICMLDRLKDLVEAGVDSLKIEGRARRGEYVGLVTGAYRRALDNNFKTPQSDKISLKKVYNRGDFCEGYLSGEKMIFPSAQNHIGIEIGRVVRINKGRRFNEIFISSNHDISKGDLLKFFNKQERGIISVQDVSLSGNLYRVTSTFLPEKGDIVRLVLDKSDEDRLSFDRRVLFDAEFIAHKNQPARLTLRHGDSSITIQSDQPLAEATSRPLDQNEVMTNLLKITPPFSLNKFSCEIENVFMVKSQLNNLRRRAEEELRDRILKDYLINNNLSYKKTPQKTQLFNEKTIIKKYFLTNKLNFPAGYDGYIFYPNIYDDKTFLSLDFSDKKIFLATPVFATQKEVEMIKNILKKFPKLGIYANNYYALNLTDKNNTIIGVNMNIFNSYAIDFYSNLGYKNIVLTQENIDLSSIKNCGANLIYLSSFHTELMNFAHCPIKEHVGGDCGDCHFKEGYYYLIAGRELYLERHKLINCHFILRGRKKEERAFPFSCIEED